MLMALGLLVLGFVLLVKGADWFVAGAADIARRLGIPQLIVGLTIVAMGTSMPEAAVSIAAALQGSADITVGNVLGSNIMNILNYDVTDIFAKMGINTAGGKFVFNPPKQKDDTKRVGVLRTLKNDLGLPISHEYLYEEFGVPKPDNYEELVEEMKA